MAEMEKSMAGINSIMNSITAELTNISGKSPENPRQMNYSRADVHHAGLRRARFAIRALVVYRSLGQDALVSDLRSLLEHVDSDWPDLFSITDLYTSVGNRLLRAGLSLKAYIIEKVLHTENPFSITAESVGAACLAGGSVSRRQAEACDRSKDPGTGSNQPCAAKDLQLSEGSALLECSEGTSGLNDQPAPVLFGKALGEAVKSDLAQLQALAEVRSEWIRDAMLHLCGEDDAIREAVMKLPQWPGGDPSWQRKADGPDGAVAPDRVRKIKELLLKSDSWPGCAEELAEFHRSCGSGIFSKYRSFVWRRVPAIAVAGGYNIPGINPAYNDNLSLIEGSCTPDPGTTGCFVGVGSPDPVRFSDLVSYELEREEVIRNTLHFLDGRPANNILLYGDRGTGKSSTVKALANEYHDRGLRIIEVPKSLLADFPLIIRRLAGRSLKFILFIDDLSFEDNDEDFTALKAMLEGGLETKPGNVLIYATSNRKHLVRERFSDRAGLASGNADDEVRAADTMQEKLSLADRFGMTVVFSSPDRKTYLEIVEGIAKKRGLEVDREYLHREAMKWELQYNGRSPRTARQFVDWLEANFHG